VEAYVLGLNRAGASENRRSPTSRDAEQIERFFADNSRRTHQKSSPYWPGESFTRRNDATGYQGLIGPGPTPTSVYTRRIMAEFWIPVRARAERKWVVVFIDFRGRTPGLTPVNSADA